MITKAEKKSKEKQSRNRKYKTLIKNQFKKVEVYLQEKKNDEEQLKKLVLETQKILDKASSKKIIHKNKAARKKSQLFKNLNRLNKEKEVIPEA